MALSKIPTQMYTPFVVDDTPAAGSVIQVISNVMSGVLYSSASGYVNLPDLTTTITPRAATSKIHINLQITISAIGRYHMTRLYRAIGGGSEVLLANGDVAGTSRSTGWMSLGTGEGTNVTYEQHTVSGTFLDSPNTTSAIVYKPKVGNYQSGADYAINSAHYGSGSYDAIWNSAPITTFTVMEIAG